MDIEDKAKKIRGRRGTTYTVGCLLVLTRNPRSNIARRADWGPYSRGLHGNEQQKSE